MYYLCGPNSKEGVIEERESAGRWKREKELKSYLIIKIDIEG